MKKLILALVVGFAAQSYAVTMKPMCSGNKKLAKEAIQSAADASGGPCKLKKVKLEMSWPSRDVEGWVADVSCPGQLERGYSVNVKRANGVCTAGKVTRHALTGAQCGLTDMWGGEEDESQPQWQFDDSKKITVQDLTPAQILALPAHTKQQLILATGSDFEPSIQDAVKALIEGSEGGEVYVFEFSFKGKNYDAVESYPGGNPVGLIFPRGGTKAIAVNGDGSISCEE